MLSAEENELLTWVGPGTPCGELMRRYWHPVAAVVQLDENPVRLVRILGEDLVLYRDRSGSLGLIAERCPHRAVHMQFGIPEDEGLRCPYHGWMFDQTGQCTEQPLEPPDSTYKDRIKTKAYPVQEMGGLVWAYLGPSPAPWLPRWDLFVREGGFRQIVAHQLPCNWLQVMENRTDQAHATYLHGRFFQYALERQGRLTDDPQARYNNVMRAQNQRLERGVYIKQRPIMDQYGISRGSLESDQPEDTPAWLSGPNVAIFPYMHRGIDREGIRQSFQIGVPIDDTHTWHMQYFCYTFPPELRPPEQPSVPYAEVPIQDADGEYIVDYVLGQDMAAWDSQGGIVDRSQEHLATTDALVLAYRRLLRQQIEVVRDGGEPMNVFRSAPESGVLEPPRPEGEAKPAQLFYRGNYHRVSQGGWQYIEDDADRYCPDRSVILDLYQRLEAMRG